MNSKVFKIVLVIITILIGTQLFGQDNPKVQTIQIATSAECGQCKKILEDKLNYTKGVKYAELDVKSKTLTVSYQTKQLSAQNVKLLVSDIGYDADDLPANSKSQRELPKCCQPGGMKGK